VCHETDQRQAIGRLQSLYVWRGTVLCAHAIVCVRVYCVCLVIYTYITTLVTPRVEDRVVPRISAMLLPRTHHAILFLKFIFKLHLSWRNFPAIWKQATSVRIFTKETGPRFRNQ